MMSRQPTSRFGPESEPGETLPLFAESGSFAVPEEPPPAGSSVQPRLPVESAADRHLRAATRLAKSIRRLPERSAQQVKTGRAICRHLIALLEGEPERHSGRNSGQKDQRH